MSTSRTLPGLTEELEAIKSASLWKTERPITSPQSAHIKVCNARDMLNFCANNYLGLADHPALIEAAKNALDSHGLGMASVRFICGTNDLHQALEAKIAAYLGMEDCITFAACFDANGAVFEPLFGDKDAIISDSLNHASIIDGIRLSKAARYRYANGDMADLEAQLKAARAANARRVVIVTDGVFSMDGYFADLVSIRALADTYDALIMVDDCHATGFIGPKGAGTPARAGVKVDILTGTLGKALGGSMGGYIAASHDIVALMRQRARPYLFSNALAPPSQPQASKPSNWRVTATPFAPHSSQTPPASVPAWQQQASLCFRASTPSSPSCWARQNWRRKWHRACMNSAFSSPAFSSPSCRKAKPASAHKCPPRTPAQTLIKPSPPSRRRVKNLA